MEEKSHFVRKITPTPSRDTQNYRIPCSKCNKHLTKRVKGTRRKDRQQTFCHSHPTICKFANIYPKRRQGKQTFSDDYAEIILAHTISLWYGQVLEHYPGHKGPPTSIKSRDVINPAMAKEVFQLFDIFVSIYT